MKEETVVAVVFRDANGRIDVDKTKLALEGALLDQVTAEEVAMDAIQEEVYNFFKLHGDQTLPVKSVCTLVGARLTTNPKEIGRYEEMIHRFLQTSDDYTIVRGKGGGVKRS